MEGQKNRMKNSFFLKDRVVRERECEWHIQKEQGKEKRDDGMQQIQMRFKEQEHVDTTVPARSAK